MEDAHIKLPHRHVGFLNHIGLVEQDTHTSDRSLSWHSNWHPGTVCHSKVAKQYKWKGPPQMRGTFDFNLIFQIDGFDNSTP